MVPRRPPRLPPLLLLVLLAAGPAAECQQPFAGSIQLTPGVDQMLLGISDEAQLAAAGERARRDFALSEDVPSKETAGYGQELRADVVKNPSNLVFGVDGALFVACFTLDHVSLQPGTSCMLCAMESVRLRPVETVPVKLPQVVRFELSEPTADRPTLSASYKIFASELDGPSALAVDHRNGGGACPSPPTWDASSCARPLNGVLGFAGPAQGCSSRRSAGTRSCASPPPAS